MNRTKVRERYKHKFGEGISEFYGVNADQKCFIVGAGPSLNGLDISGIHDSVVISVNASCLLMPWSTKGNINRRFWLSNDALCLQMSYFGPHVLDAHCHRIIRSSWSKHYQKLIGHQFNIFNPRKSQLAPLSLKMDELCHSSSVPTAIDFAIFMKCNPIYLVGVDHLMIEGKSHFWQFWPKEKHIVRTSAKIVYRPNQPSQKKVFDKNLKVFDALKDYATLCGISIYNCSPISTVKTFQFMELASAIQNS